MLILGEKALQCTVTQPLQVVLVVVGTVVQSHHGQFRSVQLELCQPFGLAAIEQNEVELGQLWRGAGQRGVGPHVHAETRRAEALLERRGFGSVRGEQEEPERWCFGH
jgi:hypothetical protein